MSRAALVLVIEANPAIRGFLRTALWEEGYEVVATADEQSALAWLASHTPAAILLDHLRQGCQQPSFLDRYRQLCVSRVPMILFSTERLSTERVRSLGLHAALTKPCDVETLLSAVESAVRLRAVSAPLDRSAGDRPRQLAAWHERQEITRPRVVRRSPSQAPAHLAVFGRRQPARPVGNRLQPTTWMPPVAGPRARSGGIRLPVATYGVARRSEFPRQRVSTSRPGRRLMVGLALLLGLVLWMHASIGVSHAQRAASTGTGRTSTPMVVRAAETARRRLGARPVAWLEDSWYTLRDRVQQRRYWLAHRRPTPSAPAVPAAGPTAHATVLATPSPQSVRPPRSTAHLPTNLVVPADWPQAPGEGVWTPAGRRVHGQIAMEQTFVLPDPQRPYARVALVWIDPHLAHLHLAAGTRHPRVRVNAARPGDIPLAARPHLLAAFNGGFKRIGGRYRGFGFRAGGAWYRKATPGLATLAVTASHHVLLGAMGQEVPSSPAPRSLLQNLPLIIDHGRVSSHIDQGAYWGETVRNAVRVWRSGLGQTAGGDLLYAAGTPLTARILAQVLQRAGSQRAMELDINSYWVTFNFYSYQPVAGATGHVRGQKLLAQMVRPADRYLTPDRRSFVYLTAAQAK